MRSVRDEFRPLIHQHGVKNPQTHQKDRGDKKDAVKNEEENYEEEEEEEDAEEDGDKRTNRRAEM